MFGVPKLGLGFGFKDHHAPHFPFQGALVLPFDSLLFERSGLGVGVLTQTHEESREILYGEGACVSRHICMESLMFSYTPKAFRSSLC